MALPTTGTAALLDLLSAFVPDDELCEALPGHRGSGRRTDWSPAQLLRVLLLLLLTPARSTNLLCQLLPEHRAWRRFAHLPNRCRLPSPRQLHEFRLRLTPGVLRGINEHLLRASPLDLSAIAFPARRAHSEPTLLPLVKINFRPFYSVAPKSFRNTLQRGLGRLLPATGALRPRLLSRSPSGAKPRPQFYLKC